MMTFTAEWAENAETRTAQATTEITAQQICTVIELDTGSQRIKKTDFSAFSAISAVNYCGIFLIFASFTARMAVIRGGEMKRIILLCLVISLSCFVMSTVVQAENFPADPAGAGQPQKIAPPSANQQQTFYGYVPPAPIRHTWPGGYRVIFSELTNTLIEHIIGQY